jgi:ATP-dependent RNA helicase RhlE
VRATNSPSRKKQIRITTFSELPLSSALQRKLAAAQFIKLTPIQERAIPPALEGRDVIGTADTGTGKTLAFLTPLIEAVSWEPARHTVALVLMPTRELAMQVHEQYEQLRTNAMPKAALTIGGVSEKAQIHSLRAGSELVIATPGRLQDLVNRKFADLRQVKLLVLDEADRMLDMGFLPAIRRILSTLPKRRQVLCFSATMEQSVAGLINDYMRDPVRVALGSVLKPAEARATQGIRSTAGRETRRSPPTTACGGQTLVFTRTKRGTERLTTELVRDGFAAAMIHGDRSQSQRNGALGGFQEGRFQVLVATDTASRGLHVDDVAHVIQLRCAQYGGGLYPSSREDGQSWAPWTRLDIGDRSRGAGIAANRTYSEAEDRMPTAGHDADGAIAANDSKHASLANSNRLAGRGICVERQVLSPGHQAPASCKRQAKAGSLMTHARSPWEMSLLFESFPCALPRQAAFTRRFSPGFK